MRRWLAALGLLVLVATAPARAASPEATGEVTSLGGGATVAVDGTTVTITVRIDIRVLKDVETQFAARIYNEVKAAENMWNGALAKLPAHGCFDVKVVFDVRLLTKDDGWDPGYHQVEVDPDRPCTSNPYPDLGQRSWAANDPHNPHPQQDCQPDCLINGEPPDFDAPYRRSLEGWFCPSAMTTKTYAHEIGHFMGLRDDYGDVPGLGSICFAGRGGTLMCDGRKIDQALADRLVNIVDFVKLPQCWKGTLKIASSFLAVKPNTCSDTWKLDFRVVIDAAGKASGSGINRRASPVKGGPFCGPGPLGSYQQQPYSVSGDADHVRLRLQFRESCCGSPAGAPDYSRVQMVLNESFATPRTYVIPVTAPGVAKGHFDTSFVAQTGSIDAQLECATCAGFGSKH